MGTAALYDLGEKLLKPVAEAAETSLEKHLPGASEILDKTIHTYEHTFNKTEPGKMLYDDIRGPYAQTKHKAQMSFMQAGKSAEEATNMASNLAVHQTFGPRAGRIAGTIKAAQIEMTQRTGSEAVGKAHAQALADHVAMIIHQNVKDGLKPKAPATNIKSLMTKNKELDLDIKTESVYSPTTPVERAVKNYFYRTMAPFIAVPHIMTNANVLFGAPLSSLAKSIGTMATDYKGAQSLLATTGVMTESYMHAAHDLEAFNSGTLKKLLPDSAAYFIHRVVNQPGFSAERKFTVTLAGVVADHSSAEYAQRFADKAGVDRHAEIQLREVYGMRDSDLQQIIQNKGKLTQDQRAKAIYRGVDAKVFLNPNMNRAYYANKNGFTRVATVFHSYVIQQARLMRQEARRALQSNNPGYLAANAALLGVIFPLGGMFTYDMEKFFRGDWQDIHPGEDLATLRGKHGLTPALEAYIDAYTHTAAFGIGASFASGALRNTLANSLMGGIYNTIIQDAQDTGQAVVKTAEGKPSKTVKGAWKKVGRDAIEAVPAGQLSKIAANAIFPRKRKKTAAEKAARSSTKMRMGSTRMHM